MEIFEELSDYRDSAKLAEECRKRIEEIEREEEDKRKATEKAAKKAKLTKIISVVSVALIVVAIGIYNIVLAPMMKYNKAVTLLESGSYDEAISSFTELGDYQDSANKIIECGKAKEYKSAEVLLDSGEYEDAKELFTNLGDYKNSADMVKKCDSEKEKKVKANIMAQSQNKTDFIPKLEV